MPGRSDEESDLRLADRVFTWAVVYRKIPIAQLDRSLAGLLVLDPDAYEAAEIARLRKAGRLVIAYLSVGEAEAYRAYATHAAMNRLRGAENPHWKDNFRVAFEDPDWQAILASYVREIMAKGFDGLFCDVVDAWEEHPEPAAARAAMGRLICALADQARALRPRAILLLQNSHPLFDDPAVFARCDGLSQESLHASWAKERPSADWLAMKREALSRLRGRGKFIGLIEYTRNPARMRIIREQALTRGFIPYFTTRNLDRLFPIP